MNRSAKQQDDSTMRGGSRGRVKEVYISADGDVYCSTDIATAIAQGKAQGHTHYNPVFDKWMVDADGRVSGKRYINK